MKIKITLAQNFALTLADAAHNVERRLDMSLGAIRGISYAEYRLLKSLGDAPQSRASRVDLAHQIGITPSGITRALRPLEKLGVVKTVKAERDAAAVSKALAAIADACRSDRNVMPTIVDAAKAYCTEQEICDVLREVFGQHQDRPEF